MANLPSTVDPRHISSLLRRGFAALERPLHPVQDLERDGVPYLHWPTRGRRGQEFTDEFYAIDTEPASILAALQAANPGPDHLIAELAFRKQPDETAWIDAGYEFGSREPVMIASLEPTDVTVPHGVVVSTLTRMIDAERVLEAHRAASYPQRLFTQALLDDPALSIRVVWSASGEFMAIGKAAMLDDGAYITDVMTMPSFRKQGIGGLIMNTLQQDAIRAGCPIAILTSTAIGKSLYESLGYQDIGIQTLYATPEHA